MIKYVLYLLRWQLSTPILFLCIQLMQFSSIVETILANLIGGLIFFWVDRIIFKNKEAPKKEGTVPKPKRNTDILQSVQGVKN